MGAGSSSLWGNGMSLQQLAMALCLTKGRSCGPWDVQKESGSLVWWSLALSSAVLSIRAPETCGIPRWGEFSQDLEQHPSSNTALNEVNILHDSKTKAVLRLVPSVGVNALQRQQCLHNVFCQAAGARAHHTPQYATAGVGSDPRSFPTGVGKCRSCKESGQQIKARDKNK